MHQHNKHATCNSCEAVTGGSYEKPHHNKVIIHLVHSPGWVPISKWLVILDRVDQEKKGTPIKRHASSMEHYLTVNTLYSYELEICVSNFSDSLNEQFYILS